jgi:lipid II:glycine glycyltransferase (peptidoglycan interpeptide bridge formation enzyme)
LGRYTVSILENLDSGLHESWNRIVTDAKEGTFFQSAEWCTILQNYGQASKTFKPNYVVVEDNDKNELVGVMSLFLDRNEVMLSPPYGDYGGPCLSSALSENEKMLVIDEMLSKIEAEFSRKVKKLLIKSVKEDYLKCFSNFGYETRPAYFTFLLPVSNRDMDAIVQGFRRDARRGIKKAEKSDIIVEEMCEKDSLQYYYEIYTSTMKKLEATVRSLSFFEILWDVLHPNNSLYALLARHKEKYVAGIISISWKRVLHIFGNVSLSEYLKQYPNDLIYYDTIKWAMNNGHGIVDFGLTSLDKSSGLYQFKERWGGTPKLLYVATKTCRESPIAGLRRLARRTLSPLRKRESHNTDRKP